MSLIPLPTVQAKLRPGTPLPWHILNDKGHILWSRSEVPSPADFVSLGLGRGLFVDSAEVLATATLECANNTFFIRWHAWALRLALLLRDPTQSDFLAGVREVAEALVSLAAFDADKVLFAVLRHDHSDFCAYGVSHSQHVAALCALLSHRLGWAAPKRVELACAALTMNLSILELQGILAAGGGRLTAAQKSLIRSHPGRSADLLSQAGLAEGPWLVAVTNHHERADGSGYPNQPAQLDEFSPIIHLVDVFTAKHAARFDRQPVPVAEAVRSLVQEARPDAALLATVMGTYPPGCFVRLASGEAGVVLRRAVPNAEGPVIAVLTNPANQLLATPEIRTCRTPRSVIAHALNDSALLVRLEPEALYRERVLADVA